MYIMFLSEFFLYIFSNEVMVIGIFHVGREFMCYFYIVKGKIYVFIYFFNAFQGSDGLLAGIFKILIIFIII